MTMLKTHIGSFITCIKKQIITGDYMHFRKTLNCFLTISIIFLTLNAANGQELHKVLKVIDGDTIYIDLNNDGCPQKNEKVRINGIDTFETRRSGQLTSQAIWYDITESEALQLGLLGKKYAINNLLNKFVRAEYTADKKIDKYNRHLMSVYVNDKDYAKEILKEGLAVVYRKSNIAPDLQQYENIDKMKNIIKR